MASFLHGLKQYVYSSDCVESYYNHKNHIWMAFFLTNANADILINPSFQNQIQQWENRDECFQLID